MSFDVDALLRRLAAQERARPLRRRADSRLTFASPTTVPPGSRILLDSCVYIDLGAGRLPVEAKSLLVGRFVFHSTICIAELAHGLGALDPRGPDHARHASAIRDILARIEQSSGRVIAPADSAAAIGGALSGLVSRRQGYGKDDRRRALSDAVLLASAADHGLTLLTANLADFDLLQQLMPGARVAFYRPRAPT